MLYEIFLAILFFFDHLGNSSKRTQILIMYISVSVAAFSLLSVLFIVLCFCRTERTRKSRYYDIGKSRIDRMFSLKEPLKVGRGKIGQFTPGVRHYGKNKKREGEYGNGDRHP